MKMTIKRLSDNTETVIIGKYRDMFSEQNNRDVLKLLDKIEMNREMTQIICFNEEFETVFEAEKDSDRDMVNLFYSLHYHSKEFIKQQEDDKKQKELINNMFKDVVGEYKEASIFKEDKPKKKVPYYNKNRPF
jgi:hypothetical protein